MNVATSPKRVRGVKAYSDLAEKISEYADWYLPHVKRELRALVLAAVDEYCETAWGDDCRGDRDIADRIAKKLVP